MKIFNYLLPHYQRRLDESPSQTKNATKNIFELHNHGRVKPPAKHVIDLGLLTSLVS